MSIGSVYGNTATASRGELGIPTTLFGTFVCVARINPLPIIAVLDLLLRLATEAHVSSVIPLSNHHCQIPDAHQVVCGGCKSEHPTDQLQTTMPQLSHAAHRLHPTKDLFHPLALLPADPVARMPRRSPIYGTAAWPIRVLRYVWCDLQIPALRDESFGVIRFIASYRHALIPRNLFQHDQRRIPFGGAVGLEYLGIHNQPVAVLHQDASAIAQFGFFSPTFSGQHRIRISRGLMGLIAATFAMEVHRRIARVIRRPRLTFIHPLKALQTRAGFQ